MVSTIIFNIIVLAVLSFYSNIGWWKILTLIAFFTNIAIIVKINNVSSSIGLDYNDM